MKNESLLDDAIIEEGNQLITTYVGHNEVAIRNLIWLNDGLKYHLLWDWIMPVCKKFDELYLEENTIPEEQDWQYEQHCDSIDNAVSSYEIERAFLKLIEGIKWFNEYSKK